MVFAIKVLTVVIVIRVICMLLTIRSLVIRDRQFATRDAQVFSVKKLLVPDVFVMVVSIAVSMRLDLCEWWRFVRMWVRVTGCRTWWCGATVVGLFVGRGWLCLVWNWKERICWLLPLCSWFWGGGRWDDISLCCLC